MSDGINRVTLLGNLGADPELRFTQGGEPVLNLRLATTESWFDKTSNARKERTDWHSVTVWGKRGEALAKFLAKGSQLLVEGRLSTSSYDDKDGNKRYKTEVVAQNVVLCGGRSREGEAPRRPGAAAPTPEPPGPNDMDGGGDDDIPF